MFSLFFGGHSVFQFFLLNYQKFLKFRPYGIIYKFILLEILYLFLTTLRKFPFVNQPSIFKIKFQNFWHHTLTTKLELYEHCQSSISKSRKSEFSLLTSPLGWHCHSRINHNWRNPITVPVPWSGPPFWISLPTAN